jgi:cystathionine beta-lyase/cystathionine gamma-synthase
LIDNDQVSKVFYPKYADAGQREIVDKQMSLFGAMVSFELKENVDNTEFIEHLKLIPLAEESWRN